MYAKLPDQTSTLQLTSHEHELLTLHYVVEARNDLKFNVGTTDLPACLPEEQGPTQEIMTMPFDVSMEFIHSSLRSLYISICRLSGKIANFHVR